MLFRSLVREYLKTHPLKSTTREENIFCTIDLLKDVPPSDKPVPIGQLPDSTRYMDQQTGRVLVTLASGQVVEYEHPCLVGFGRPEYRAFDLDGNYVCSKYGVGNHIKDPDLPQPFQGRGGITFAGFNLDDLNRLLGSSGGSPDLSGVVRLLAALVLTGQRYVE